MRYIIIYAVLNPTPKGVGDDLNVHFTFFRNPKFIAPKRLRASKIFLRKKKTASLRDYSGLTSAFAVAVATHNLQR